MKKSLFKAWFLRTEAGRQRWFFDLEKAKQILGTSDESLLYKTLDEQFVFDRKNNANASDAVLREQAYSESSNTKPSTPSETLQKGIQYFASLQQEAGNWSGDYGGPHFLTPGLVMVLYACDEKLPEEKQLLLRRYILNHQLEDGGWGLHIEDQSTMFGTVLNAVSAVLLGAPIDSPAMQSAFQWIHQHGGTETIPPWGKLYLAILGLYDWKGLDAMPPEMWLLPKKFPIYPGNYWNHARMVYLPMSFLSGTKPVRETDPLLESLKQALYPTGMQHVNWKKARRACCPLDDYFPETKLYRFVAPFLNGFDRFHFKFLRKRALKNILDRIQMENLHTNFINLGPVNKVLNMYIAFQTEGKSESFHKHKERLDDYLWLAEDGMKMSGYNGSQFWDTIFFGHALLEKTEFTEHDKLILKGVENYLVTSLVRENEQEYQKFDRSISKGGWPFSTAAHGWPITDCTAEGMKAVIYLHQKIGLTDQSLLAHIDDSLQLLLPYQNSDGGWASYEKTRAPQWLERLNPSRIFGEIMVDYSYVECTSACLQGIQTYIKYKPNTATVQLQAVIDRGVNFILSKQQESGLWYGSWAVCFTYGTWFAVEALVQCKGLKYERLQKQNPITKACDALVSVQREDGSWGESYQACIQKKYVQHQEGQVINTAWAIMTLLAANYDDVRVIDRAINFLMEKQEPTGDWPQQGISGVFNHNCMITYVNYRNIFPLWALQRYENVISNGINA